MLDGSPALVKAVAYLSDARRRQQTSPQPDMKLDLKLHGSALQGLRMAFQDPNQLTRIETLLATIILWKIEVSI